MVWVQKLGLSMGLLLVFWGAGATGVVGGGGEAVFPPARFSVAWQKWSKQYPGASEESLIRLAAERHSDIAFQRAAYRELYRRSSSERPLSSTFRKTTLKLLRSIDPEVRLIVLETWVQPPLALARDFERAFVMMPRLNDPEVRWRVVEELMIYAPGRPVLERFLMGFASDEEVRIRERVFTYLAGGDRIAPATVEVLWRAVVRGAAGAGKGVDTGMGLGGTAVAPDLRRRLARLVALKSQLDYGEFARSLQKAAVRSGTQREIEGVLKEALRRATVTPSARPCGDILKRVLVELRRGARTAGR